MTSIERGRVVGALAISVGLCASGAARASTTGAAPVAPAPATTGAAQPAAAPAAAAQLRGKSTRGPYEIVLSLGAAVLGDTDEAIPMLSASAGLRRDMLGLEVGVHRHFRTDWVVGLRWAILSDEGHEIYLAGRYSGMWPGQENEDLLDSDLAHLTLGYEVPFGEHGILDFEVGGLRVLDERQDGLIAMMHVGSRLGW